MTQIQAPPAGAGRPRKYTYQIVNRHGDNIDHGKTLKSLDQAMDVAQDLADQRQQVVFVYRRNADIPGYCDVWRKGPSSQSQFKGAPRHA